MPEDFLFDETNNGLAVILAGAALEDGTIRIGEGDVSHAGHERIKAAMVMGLAGRECD